MKQYVRFDTLISELLTEIFKVGLVGSSRYRVKLLIDSKSGHFANKSGTTEHNFVSLYISIFATCIKRLFLFLRKMPYEERI